MSESKRSEKKTTEEYLKMGDDELDAELSEALSRRSRAPSEMLDHEGGAKHNFENSSTKKGNMSRRSTGSKNKWRKND